MKRPLQNFVINFVALGLFLGLSTTGFLMRYLLPPGSHGVGIWGLGRHDWGGIHFWIAVAMLSTIAVHLLLHGRWIIHMVKGRKTGTPRERIRLVAGGVVLAVLVAVASAPLLGTRAPVAAEAHEEEGEHGQGRAEGSRAGNGTETPGEIRGFMTLYDVEQTTGITVASLVQALNLPAEVSSTVPLKTLATTYGFDVHAVRDLVTAHLGSRGIGGSNSAP